jgi:hypothetical protein
VRGEWLLRMRQLLRIEMEGLVELVMHLMCRGVRSTWIVGTMDS